MTEKEAKDIIAKGEGLNIEFKSCQNEIGNSVYETVCSFLNHSGGYIFIGVNDEKEVIGVNENNLEQMKKNFVHVINDPNIFSPKTDVSPEDIMIDGKRIIYLKVEESQYVHRFKHKYYDRNNDADANVTDNPSLIASLFSRKDTQSYENRLVPMLEMDDLDDKTFHYCRKLVAMRNDTHAWIKLSNEELLKSCGLIAKDSITGKTGIKMAALLLFGKNESIATFIPAYRFEALYRNKSYERFIQNKAEDIIRYDDRVTIRTNLIKAYTSLMEFAYKHLPEKFYLQDGTTQRGDLRSNIFREIVANLCVHREYASNEAGLFEIFSDRVKTYNATKFTSILKTGSISIDELENYTKNPLLFKVFRELGWGEELGSGSRNIKKFAPLYYDKSVIEITNQEHFIFSITYNDIEDSVKSDADNSVKSNGDSVNSSNGRVKYDDDSVNSKIGVVSEPVQLTDDKIEGILSTLLGTVKISKAIKKRMVQELKQIYHAEKINRTALSERLGYTASQIKGDLHVLMQEKKIIFSAKERTYSLPEDVLTKIKA